MISRQWRCFFFSSRRRHTRLQGDWSSDVCSSDLIATVSPKLTKPEGRDLVALRVEVRGRNGKAVAWQLLDYSDEAQGISAMRSEERRVGKEGRSRWSPYH